MSKKESRFAEIYSQKNPRIRVLVDLATGVNYIFYLEDFGQAGGLTPLLNADGTPVVTPPEMFRTN